MSDWCPSPTSDPLAYPGKIPSYSYVLTGNEVVAVDGSGEEMDEWLGSVPAAGRHPVLAVGSNAAPSRLAEKAGREPVAAVRVMVHDHSIVYSAHVARYGSIAATLHPDPGARCRLHVTLLTSTQLAVVDQSEGSYRRLPLAEGVIEDVGAGWSGPVERYASRWGPLLVDGAPVRVAEIDSDGSAFAAADQATIQRRSAQAMRESGRIGAGTPGTVAALLNGGHASQQQLTAWLGE